MTSASVCHSYSNGLPAHLCILNHLAVLAVQVTTHDVHFLAADEDAPSLDTTSVVQALHDLVGEHVADTYILPIK